MHMSLNKSDVYNFADVDGEIEFGNKILIIIKDL